MQVADIIPPDGEHQRVYCKKCGANCDLNFHTFDDDIEGIRVKVEGLPVLRCPVCADENLPDRSRACLLRLHEEATLAASKVVSVKRKKLTDTFGFTKVPFIYDPDDYYYIPGLTRPWDQGFLQPVFFRRPVLFKYDNMPDYRVHFASTTYGTIYMPEHSVSFGINRNGNVVMWLGDIGNLSESEQYYLRSENIQSDHSLGSEFYDGQIEVKFTDLTAEDKLLAARSDFLERFFTKFGLKIGHLDAETFEIAEAINRPVVDSVKERQYISDALNKVYIESFDSKALEKVRSSLGASDLRGGSLKKLQAILEKMTSASEAAVILMPLFVLYDMRVAYLHIGSAEGTSLKLASITGRLDLPEGADLQGIYDRLVELLTATFNRMGALVKSAE